MNIELLCIEQCANAEAAESRLRQVLSEFDAEYTITKTVIRSQKEATQRQFIGSPSIRINGKDIEGTKDDVVPSLACRIYRQEEGTSGLPSTDLVRRAVRQALQEKT